MTHTCKQTHCSPAASILGELSIGWPFYGSRPLENCTVCRYCCKFAIDPEVMLVRMTEVLDAVRPFFEGREVDFGAMSRCVLSHGALLKSEGPIPMSMAFSSSASLSAVLTYSRISPPVVQVRKQAVQSRMGSPLAGGRLQRPTLDGRGSPPGWTDCHPH